MYDRNRLKESDIALMAIDLDDTLLNEAGEVTARTAKAIRRARENGIYIVLATGRMFSSAQPVSKKLSLGDVPMILYSGGSIQRALTGNTIFENAIPEAVAHEILAMAKEKGWYLQSYVNDTLWIDRVTEFTKRYENSAGVGAHSLGDAFYTMKGNPIKILALDTPEAIDEIAKEIEKHWGDSIGCVRSRPTYLEIMKKGVSKGEAVLYLAESLGVLPEQIMTFGNAPNDISMLEVAGIGVAVGNAEPMVKEVATIVTDSNDEDGVAKVIEDYIALHDIYPVRR